MCVRRIRVTKMHVRPSAFLVRLNPLSLHLDDNKQLLGDDLQNVVAAARLRRDMILAHSMMLGCNRGAHCLWLLTQQL